jgi:hypothetical protein
LVNYIESKIKVKIICSTHGIFEQAPSQHLVYGCNKCAIQNRTHTSEYFTSQASIVHENKYDYKLVDYVNNCTKVDIVCQSHGIFQQTPGAHLFGIGCPGCGKDSLKLTLDEVICRSNVVHDFKYDYSLVVYTGSHDNIRIICPNHGVFEQQAGNHLFGAGCRKCTKSVSKSETSWLNGLGIPLDYRQHTIVINKRRFNVDAYDPNVNVIYEFYGDFWHGNPEIYNFDDYNWVKHKTFGELYSNTIERECCIKNAGYKVIAIWENDFRQQTVNKTTYNHGKDC